MSLNFHRKMVLRGRYGLSPDDLFTNGLNHNYEESFASSNVQQPAGDPRAACYLSHGPHPVVFNPAPDGSVPFVGTNFSSRNISWYDPKLRNPYIMNWSAGWQYQLTNDVLTELIYQG